MRQTLLQMAGLLTAVFVGAGAQGDTAKDALERAVRAMGDISDVGGVVFEGRGVIFQAAERQGLMDHGRESSRFREVIAVDVRGRRASHEQEHARLDGSQEHIRMVHPAPGEWMVTGMREGWAVRFADERFTPGMMRMMRRVPQVMAREAMASGGARLVGERDGLDLVAYEIDSGRTITLGIDRAGLVRSASFEMDAPTFGDALIAWSFDEYEEVGPLLLPREYGVSIEGRRYTRMRVTDARVMESVDDGLFGPAPGAATPEARPAPADMFDPTARAQVREVAPGVHQARHLRAGFHPAFVEFDDFVVAFDAPAGYPLLHEIPASDVAYGATSATLSERYIELIAEATGGKPVRYVVLTHFHNDHAGGLRAFMARGATVVAGAEVVDLVRALASEAHTIAPDRFARDPRAFDIAGVDEVYEITDGSRTLEVVAVGENPHAEGLLVGRLPAQRIVIESDFLYPGPIESFPDPMHAAGARWFGRWLDARGWDPEMALTSHASGVARREHLDKARSLD